MKVVNTSREGLVLRWRDPATLKEKQRAAKTDNWKKAEKLAHKLEAELENGHFVEPSRAGWQDFRDRYEVEHLEGLAVKTYAAATTALNAFEKEIGVQRLADVTPQILSTFQRLLREKEKSAATIACYLRHIRAALNWAKTVGLLASVPKINMPRRERGARLMRGRPVNTDEFKRMLKAVKLERPNDAAEWRRYLRGLWLSGLRLQESVALSWDEGANVRVEEVDGRPYIVFMAEGQKSFRDERLPATPAFARLLQATPVEHRTGRVFRLVDDHDRQLLPEWVGKVVSRIGEQAGVIVNQDTGKYASAHDLRRAFGSRWAMKVSTPVLQRLMRHESIQTTIKYYVNQNAKEMAEQIWRTKKVT